MRAMIVKFTINKVEIGPCLCGGVPEPGDPIHWAGEAVRQALGRDWFTDADSFEITMTEVEP